MHLEDELFDVLELSKAETRRLRVSGGSTSEHQGWQQEAWTEQEGKSSQRRVGCAEWATDTSPAIPRSAPCSPAPTYQSLCLGDPLPPRALAGVCMAEWSGHPLD